MALQRFPKRRRRVIQDGDTPSLPFFWHGHAARASGGSFAFYSGPSARRPYLFVFVVTLAHRLFERGNLFEQFLEFHTG